ncbi:MAG: tetratricopeptide repeat protein, partial [Chloroflexota bacterium]
MASISLRDYHSNLEKMLRQDVTDRVIAHCRHILQTYPRNGQTYRLLGRSLAASGQWERAGDIMRRVLAIYPDDFEAHYSLGDVYTHTGQLEAAIWHTERALEIQPNEGVVMERLRKLYRDHQNKTITKIPLTSSAAARQYLRSGMFNKAVDTLQQALQRQPNRSDLRLLMTQSYWENGLVVEAAETAFDLLDTLPYCFAANHIVAGLWLRENRPSDATPYLANLEQVDPYAALELVEGRAVPNETFMIEELDFQRAAQSELVASGADLFGDLELEDVDEAAVIEAADAEVTAQSVAVGSDDFFAAEIPADWAEESAEPGEVAVAGNDEDPLAWMNEDAGDEDDPLAWMNEDAGAAVAATADDDDPLAWMNEDAGAADAVDEDDPLAWMDQDGSGLTGMLQEDAVVDDGADPLAWMDQGGSGLTGMLDDSPEDPLAEGGDPLAWMDDGGAAEDDDPLAWMDGDVAEPEAVADDAQASISESSDPLAWLQSSGGEFLDEGDEAEPIFSETDALRSDNEDVFEGANPADPMAWLADDFIDPEAAEDSSAEDDDPLAWLVSPEPEVDPLELVETGPLADPALNTTDDDIPDWMLDDSGLDDAFGMEAMQADGDGFADLFGDSTESDSDGDGFADLFGDDVEPDGADDISAELFGDATDTAAADDEFADLFGDASDAGDADADLADLFGDTSDGDDDGGLAGLFDEATAADDADVADDEWLTSSADAVDGMNPLDDDDEPEWLAGADYETPPAIEPEAVDEDLDWMKGFDDLEPAAEFADDAPDDSLDWMTSDSSGSESGSEPVDVDTGSLSWMTGADEASDADEDTGDALDWMTQLDLDSEEEPVSGMDLEATDGFDNEEDDDSFSWLDGESDEASGGTDSLDWLADIEAEDDTDTGEAVTSSTSDWLADIDEGDIADEEITGNFDLSDIVPEDGSLDIEADAAAIADGDAPSWLEEARAKGTGPLSLAGMDDDDDDMDWLEEPAGDLFAEEEAETEMDDNNFDDAFGNDEPDWLGGLGDDDGGEESLDDLFAAASDEPTGEEEPSWLSDLDGGEEEPSEAGVMMSDDNMDALFGDDDDSEPDWLGGLGD